jgi:hypothetical protein
MVAWRFPVTRFSSRRVSALGCDERVLAGMVLRAEAAAHVQADHAHLVLGDPELLRGLGADAPDELGRGVDVEDVALPLTHRLMRLQRVVQDGLRPVLGLDHDVGFGQPALDVAALVTLGLVDQRAASHRFVGIEEGLQHLPLDLDQVAGRGGLGERIGSDGDNGGAREARLAGEDVEIVRGQDGAHARSLGRTRDVELRHPRVGVRAAQHGRVQHAGQLDVRGEDRLAARPLHAVDARNRLPDELERAGRPLVDRILVDHDPLLGVVALDFFLGADQSCHVRTASSILG